MLVHQVWGSSYEVVNKSGNNMEISKKVSVRQKVKKKHYSGKVGLSATEELKVLLDVILGASLMWYLGGFPHKVFPL